MLVSLTCKTSASLRPFALSDAVHGGIVCSVPALAAAYLHNLLVSWSAIAAFWSYLSIPGGNSAYRWLFGLTFGLAGAAATWLGVWVSAWPALAIGLAALLGFAGAYAQHCDARVGFPALLLATIFAVSTAFVETGVFNAQTHARYFLCGSLWATSYALLFQRPKTRAPFVAVGSSVWAALTQNFTLRSLPFVHALRVGVAGAIVVGLVQACGLNHGYWMILSVFLIMQPQADGTLKTCLERLLGTLVGGAITAVLGSYIHAPMLLAALTLPLVIGALIGRAIGLVAYMSFLTPFIIVVSQVGQSQGSELGLALLRIFNSLGGALLAVTVSLLVCPRWQAYPVSKE